MSSPSTAFPRWALAVDLVVSALSVIGGLAIVAGYLCAPQQQHLRMKLILALGITDFVQAMTTLVGTGLALAGTPYETNSSSCLASSFVYQSTVICNACWTLAITLVTYLTLLHPRSKPTGFLDSTYAFPLLAGTCVLIAIAPSIALTVVYRVEDAAGVCWLPANSLAAKLELFIPRALVLVIVIVLYGRMFVFFRTRDMHLLDTSSDSDSQQPNGNRLSSLRGRFTSSKNRNEGGRMSELSTNGLQATETPPRHLNVIPASPVPEAAAGAENDVDASESLSQTRKSSAATVSFSEYENGPSGMALPPSAILLEPIPARTGVISATSAPLPRLSKHEASSFPAAPPPPGAPRHVPLSPRQLNKRLSLLMACYPVAYSALVAVSLARLIQQFVTGGRANRGLLYASRILIFSQGAVDGILYYAIQAAFKYWTRSGRIRPTA